MIIKAGKPGETVGYRWAIGMWRSLVSAPALGAGGPGFKSRHPDRNRQVVGPGVEACGDRLARSSDRHLTVRLNANWRQLAVTDWT